MMIVYSVYFKLNFRSNHICYTDSSGIPRNFVRGGVQQIQLRTEDRQNGDLGAG